MILANVSVSGREDSASSLPLGLREYHTPMMINTIVRLVIRLLVMVISHIRPPTAEASLLMWITIAV